MSEVSPANRKTAVIDESISNTSTENCHLLMQLAGNHFSYCLFDITRNKFIALCDYRLTSPFQKEELASLVANDDLLSNKVYYKKSISIHSGNSALVPLPLYRKEDASSMLTLTSPVSTDDILCADQLKYTDTVHLYTVSKDVVDAITANLGSVNIIHSGTVLIESELLRNKNELDAGMMVNVHQHLLEIIITQGGNLIYYNSFTFHNSEDFIYYILFVMEQLKLNPEKTPLRFTGDIEKTSASYLITSKYVRNILFGERSDAYEFSYGFRQISAHAFYSLLSEYLCVS